MKKIILTLSAAIAFMQAGAQVSDDMAAANVPGDAKASAIDTLDTEDKYTKVVLYDDHTWEYIDMDRPNISDEDFADDWDSESIHAFKEVAIKDLPEEVDIALVDSTHGWACPKQERVTSGFKFRRTREHKGTDIHLTTGDPIYAAFDGKVRVVREVGKAGGYGNLIIIRHANGLETYYAHLSKHLVKEGDLVKAGEEIGLGGSTGRSTGPHLHFEVRYMGKPFDPERIFDFPNGQLRDTIFTLKRHYFNIYSHYGQTDKESAAQSEAVVHVIKSGDTLGALARRYHTTVNKICQLNGIRSTSTLRLGQRIRVR